MHIAILLNDLTSSYIISGDGISTAALQLDAPSNDFADCSPFAILQDELFIFGGSTDQQKIGKLVGCSFSLISARLSYRYYDGSAALAIENGTKGQSNILAVY